MGGAYILAVGSHKGGTGRTTAALALAWCFGQAGSRVTLVDADPIQATRLVALGERGHCDWPNVTFASSVPDRPAGDLVVVDCPALLDPSARPVLHRADGIVLTCLADPLSLRTVPAATGVIARARQENPRLELLGILLAIHDNQDDVQAGILGRLRDAHGELLLEPPVPRQHELREWPMAPGSSPPPGPARDAYAAHARALGDWIRAGAGV